MTLLDNISDKFIFSNIENIDKTMTDYIWNLEEKTMLLYVGLAVGTIFALIVVAQIAYKSMLGKGGIDILGAMRPILFAFIITNWYVVAHSLFSLTQPIQYAFATLYEQHCQEVNTLREERRLAANSVYEKYKEVKAQEQLSKEAQDEVINDQNSDEGSTKSGISGTIQDLFSDLFNGADDVGKLFVADSIADQNSMSDLIENMIVWLGEIYWEINCYFIFLMKNIFLGVLVVFGPITMACSILPIWKDAWSQWVGRMVSVSLYGAMAYLVMIFSMQLIKYGIRADINSFNAAVNDNAVLFAYMRDTCGHAGLYLVTMLCGAIALKTVPEMVTWVIPSDTARTAAQFMEGMTEVTSRAQKMATKAVVEAAKAGVAVATGGASMAAGAGAETGAATAAGTGAETGAATAVETETPESIKDYEQIEENGTEKDIDTDNQERVDEYTLADEFEDEQIKETLSDGVMDDLSEFEKELQNGRGEEYMDNLWKRLRKENDRLDGKDKKENENRDNTKEEDIYEILEEWENSIKKGKQEEFLNELERKIKERKKQDK